MTYYTIAHVNNQCCGHGDYRDFVQITAEEQYVNNVSIGYKMPPLYINKPLAEAHAKRVGGIVVPMETYNP